MWDSYCLLCGYGRMNRQEEWLAHMAGHNSRIRFSADAPAKIPEGFGAPLDDCTTAEMMADRDTFSL